MEHKVDFDLENIIKYFELDHQYCKATAISIEIVTLSNIEFCFLRFKLRVYRESLRQQSIRDSTAVTDCV